MQSIVVRLIQILSALAFSAGAAAAADPLPAGSIEAGATSPFTFFIQKARATVDVQPNGNYADIQFITREPTHALVEVSTRRFADFPDTTPAGQQPVATFPAGTITMSRNDGLGAGQLQHAFRMDGLAPNRTYYFVITTSGADGRTFRYWDSFKTPDNRRVKIVFEKINFTRKTLGLSYSYPNGKLTYTRAEALQLIAGVNDQWGAPDVGYWRYPRDGSFANIGGSTSSSVYQPAGWETVNIEAIVENAPDRLALKLLAFDAESTKEHLKGGYYVPATYPNDPRPTLFEGPQTDAGHENSDAYWSTAVGEIDTTSGGTFQAGSGSFRLIQTQEAINATNSDRYNPEFYLKYPRGLLFEVMGRFEVSYVKPRPIEISAPQDPLEKKGARAPVVTPGAGPMVKAQGRIKLDPGATRRPPLPICEAARLARARNSPAAPGLEAQCAAQAPVKAQARVKLASSSSASSSHWTRPICDIAKQARDRNSPAAPGLEAQCAAFVKLPLVEHDDLIAKGEAIAREDPLAVELLDQQPDNSARIGFDIGMAVAEKDAGYGPGKQHIHDSLPAEEQSGFRAAVDFLIERNRHGELAAAGAAIAAADPIVAAARNASLDVFYRLGFDIATGLFGDPALGARGNTATGPGSLGIRDRLSPAGQQGFNAATAFHFDRTYKP